MEGSCESAAAGLRGVGLLAGRGSSQSSAVSDTVVVPLTGGIPWS